MSFEFQTSGIQEDSLAVLERKPEVRASTPREFVRRRIAEAAERLSRAGQMAARVELVNEALHRLTQLCYEADTDGGAANVDRHTLRLLIPAPWGSAGWRQWGLRGWEGETLRRILRDRQAAYKPGQQAPLFVYDSEARYWSLNAHDYATIDHAEAWLKRCPIVLAEWRKYADHYRQRRITVQARYRRR